MQDKPTSFPTTRPDGSPLKPITEALLERRVLGGDALRRLIAEARPGRARQPGDGR